ncbi:hypothetical protein [Caldicellulosiruptor naganoensis]|uniref:BZIP domain-containing protein n=1 Tax=Caldicellulosiruptor naganoensis TaxID=29324 RepID=A0ABY7BIL6_9FIRM|nr:hypothetical protein [Caldicellulosiruptor naganoensis]WAM31416.1 hypothetical protein OTJ99_002285 [Caldicellulosiruptor naganoensis]
MEKEKNNESAKKKRDRRRERALKLIEELAGIAKDVAIDPDRVREERILERYHKCDKI